MSSTTSSDCESCDCSQCTYSFEYNYNHNGQCMMNSRHGPIYSTMAHPLIYYAQVQPTRRQNSDRPKKDNPFMKAFKWYTQERKAICGENEVAPERSGFANWLDNKYCEYMRDSGQQPTSNEPQTRNTNMCERYIRLVRNQQKRLEDSKDFSSQQLSIKSKSSVGNPLVILKELFNDTPHDGVDDEKKSSPLHIPWPKRTRVANNSGDVPQKCPEGSCEYILKPKELSRAASENCYHSPTSAGKSNATIISSHIPCNAKCSRRSQSLSDVSPEKYVYNKHVETVPLTVQEGTNISCVCGCECPQQQTEYPQLENWKISYDCLQQKAPSEAVQVPSNKQDSRNQPETPRTCQKEKVPEPVKVKSKEQELRNQPKPPCTCQNEKVSILKEPSIRPPCTCQKVKVPAITKEPLKEQDSIYQPKPPCTCLKEKVPAITKEPLKEQDSINQPEPHYTCQKKKVPAITKEPLKEQDSINQPEPHYTCQNKKVSAITKEPLKEQDSINQPEPHYTCQKKKVPAITKEPLKEQDSINQPEPHYTCQNKKVPAITKEPTKDQDSINQPVAPCNCSRERVPIAVKLPSFHEVQIFEVQQEKIPEVVKVLSYHKEALQVVEVQQEKMPELVIVPSKAQESTYDLCCKCEKKKVPKVVQVPSEDQDPRNLPGLCCSCHVIKVPEGSCQCSHIKVVPVCEETQYETALIVPLRSVQYHGPCCCNTCKPAAPPSPQPLQPQIFCLPVKVHDRKISTPDICVAPVQSVSPKKQKKVKQCITIATQCVEGIQSKVSSQCHEISECGKDKRSSCNCFEERQVFDPKPIKRESYSTIAVNKETGEYSIMKEVAVVNKLTRCLTCASNGAAQTSDHSIRFESDGCSCPYPLFFKIVYADVE